MINETYLRNTNPSGMEEYYDKEILSRHLKLTHFLGWEYVKHPRDNKNDGWFENDVFITADIRDLEFDSDWNILMKVVSKIEDIRSQKYGRFTVTIESDCCRISATNKTKETTYNKQYCASNDKLKSTYNSVIMFVEWYYSNNIK